MKTRTLPFPFAITLIIVAVVAAGCVGDSMGNKTYTASGIVTDESGTPIPGVTILFSGPYGTTKTDTQGTWSKSGLRGTVTISPLKDGYQFEPPTETITYARQVNFVGEPTSLAISPTTVTLMVDDTQVFEASGRDKYGQPVEVNPDWIVTGGIGYASPGKGKTTAFTATTPGEGTVVAEQGSMVVYAVVTVLPRQEKYPFNATYDIAETPVDETGGTVTATVDDEAYGYGISVTLTATPSDGWRFVRWEGDIESSEATIELAVIDPEREPIHPFGAGSSITWRWPPPPEEPTMTYHPEIMAYGDSLPMPTSRTEVGLALEAKFVSRPIVAVFEKL